MNLRLFLARVLLVFILTATIGRGQQPVPVQTQNPGAGPQAVPAPVASAATDDLVGPLNMPGDSLDAVLGLIERWTGKTLLRPQNLPAATLSINLKDRITKKEAIQAVETLLNLNGIALTPLGDRFLKVTPLNMVKSEAPEFIQGSTLGLTPSGRTVQKLFTLQFLRVGEFMPQIAGLLNPSAGSPPVVFDKANAALITDSVSNLQRIETLVARLDQPALAGLTPKFYGPLQNAKASDVVNKLHGILSGQLQNQLGSTTTYSADDRTNQITLLADPRQYPFFDELIGKLDVKSAPNTRNEVIQLKHATAKDVATILSQLVSGQNNAAKTAGQENLARNPQYPATPPAPGQPAQPAAPIAAAANTAASLALESGSNQFSSLLTILPDDRSNALVVSGTVDDIRLIRELVAKIDILLAQVRIEVIIAEVTLNDTDKTGISALGLTVGQSALTGKTKITNFTGSVAGWDISSGVVDPLQFAAKLTDAGSKSNVKILSAPTIVTTHNKQAEVNVGQQQPVVTGVTSTPGVTSTTNNTGLYSTSQVTYKTIAIDLKVTPLIGDDGSVQMNIDQTVDDVIGNVTVDGNAQPIIGHRQATSFVTVKDDEMIVLGGLQRTKKSANRTKMGFLHEIPILSHIFGGRTNVEERTELLLFIRPHVLKSEETTQDTSKQIDDLSNKAQVKQYLQDPTKEAKETLLEKLK